MFWSRGSKKATEREFQLVEDNQHTPLVGQSVSSSKSKSSTDGGKLNQIEMWLLNSSEAEAQQVLSSFAGKRPSEFDKIASDRRRVTMCLPSEDLKEKKDVVVKVTPKTKTPDWAGVHPVGGDSPLLQFSCSKYFCLEEEPSVTVTVLRFGPISKRTSVKYRTKDLTAIASKNYVAKVGTLVWEQGEVAKDIVIDLIDDCTWGGIVEFRVVLEEEGIENGIISLPGCSEARIQRIDDDTFPTNKYAAHIRDRRVHEIHAFGLLWEFIRMSNHDPVVFRGTIKLFLMGQLNNLFFVMKLVGNIYLVDHVLLKSEDIQEKTRQIELLVALTLIFWIPNLAMHILEYKKFSWGVVGRMRMNMSMALMNAFMYFDEASRTEVDAGALVESMTHDSEQLIKGGYMSFIKITNNLGRIIVCIAFQLFAPLITESSVSMKTLLVPVLPMTIFPFIMIMMLLKRIGMMRKVLETRLQYNRTLVGEVHEIVENFRLIADFGRRQWCMDRHQDFVTNYGKSDRAVNEISTNNIFFMKWLTLCFISAYIILGGISVINGALSTGTFLACMRVFVQVGKEWGSVYEICLSTFMHAPTLERIVNIINRPTDLRHRMYWSRRAHKMTSDTLNRIQEQEAAQADNNLLSHSLLDRVPIQLENLGVDLHTLGTCNLYTGQKLRSTRMYYESLTIHQGKLVSLVGKRGWGKSTLLRILGGAMLPEVQEDNGGVLVIPSHLKVLHVPSEAMFIRGSLYQVLTFGLVPGHPDADLDRVKRICQRLHLPTRMLDGLTTDDESPPLQWTASLSSSEKHMVVIARALIANPEVLCIHKPTLHVSDKMGQTIIELLREFVDERGVEMSTADKHKRLPRTCILTSSRVASIEAADEVFKVKAFTDADLNNADTECDWTEETNAVFAEGDESRGITRIDPETPTSQSSNTAMRGQGSIVSVDKKMAHLDKELI